MSNFEKRNQLPDDVPGSVTLAIDQFRAGDRQAFEKLWSRFFQPVLVAAKSKMRQPVGHVDHEDIAQAAMIRMSEKLPNSQVVNSNQLWRFLLVVLDGLRVDATRAACSQKRGDGAVLGENQLDMQTPDGDDSAITLAKLAHDCGLSAPDVKIALREQFCKFMGALSKEERVVADAVVRGLTIQEIAGETGLSSRTIDRRLAFIRETLRQMQQ